MTTNNTINKPLITLWLYPWFESIYRSITELYLMNIYKEQPVLGSKTKFIHTYPIIIPTNYV